MTLRIVKLSAFIFSLLPFVTLAQESVTELWTNYGDDGFWYSETAADTMDNDAIVLGFKCGETIFSTGVDDDLLSDSLGSGNFTSLKFEAIPIPSFVTSKGQYYKGAAWDGDLESSSSATGISADSVATYLTDGLQGLNITTALNNVAEAEITYLPAASPAADKFNDGVPDLLFSQVAWAGGLDEKVFLTDADDDIIGDTLTLSFDEIVTKWYADGWTISNGNNATVKAERPMYLVCIEFSDFSLIDSADLDDVAKIKVRTSGNSDPAFFAYNSYSFSDPDDTSNQSSGGEVSICYADNKSFMHFDGIAAGLDADSTFVGDKTLVRLIWESFDTEVVEPKVYKKGTIDQ